MVSQFIASSKGDSQGVGSGELSGCFGPTVTVGAPCCGRGGCGDRRHTWGDNEAGSPFFLKAPMEVSKGKNYREVGGLEAMTKKWQRERALPTALHFPQ